MTTPSPVGATLAHDSRNFPRDLSVAALFATALLLFSYINPGVPTGYRLPWRVSAEQEEGAIRATVELQAHSSWSRQWRQLAYRP